jgi:hypothetical protein
MARIQPGPDGRMQLAFEVRGEDGDVRRGSEIVLDSAGVGTTGR